MPLELPTGWVILLNVIGWPVIHLTVGWVFTRLPRRMFATAWGALEPGAIEGRVLTRVAKVRTWKRLLPDAAPWFGGFAKRELGSADRGYLHRFIAEARRGEAAHWVMLLSAGIFFLWNPPWADVVMAGYALIANLPCILIQRYNRFRLARALGTRRMHKRIPISASSQ